MFEFTASKYLLGTKIDITAVSGSIDSMKKAMYFSFKEIERIQGVMSSQIDTSEISGINRGAGINSVKVSRETYSIIERSISYSIKYPCFDITIGPISELWGFSSDHPVTKVPEQKVIDSLLLLVGYEKIILNPSDTSVYLELKGMKLDLGGIAKGYAIDRAASEMKKYGMRNFFINAGGDIYVCGKKTADEKWSIGIEHPRKKNEIFAVLELPGDGAIGSSGDYERFTIIDGKRYQHIFDVKTGLPVMTSQSATAFATTAEEAVILSKYFFILGGDNYNNGKIDLPAIIITQGGDAIYDKKLESSHNFRLLK
jgi:FAD:protein FMN transferase